MQRGNPGPDRQSEALATLHSSIVCTHGSHVAVPEGGPWSKVQRKASVALQFLVSAKMKTAAVHDVSEVALQEVVVLGSGAFACEAMEAALASGAKHVTMVCRNRKR